MNYEIPRDRLKKARLYDCGNGERLTMRQIAERAGLSERAADFRWQRGKRGPELFAPPPIGPATIAPGR